LYEFCGEGEHVIVVLRKAGRTTREIATGVARGLGVPPHAVGYAGMKDKACVATQAFSVAGADESRTQRAFEDEGCCVLRVTRHKNKLRLGHLAGNRFRAYLPGVETGSALAAGRELTAKGVPNYYGPQRFGARGDNAVRGLAILEGKQRATRWKRDLMVSALQAFVFNEVLARRLEEGNLYQALEGDVLRREDSGGLFLCTDSSEVAPRIRAFEVSPTGPMHGRKMIRPAGRPAEVEDSVLVELGLDKGLFDRQTGSRRPFRARLSEWSLDPASDGAWISFTCPAGVFATSVIRELMPVGDEEIGGGLIG
jgi:tRNA pseudouridine13 synthase